MLAPLSLCWPVDPASELLAALVGPTLGLAAFLTCHGDCPFRGFPLGFLLRPIARPAASTAGVPSGKIRGPSDKRKAAIEVSLFCGCWSLYALASTPTLALLESLRSKNLSSSDFLQ